MKKLSNSPHGFHRLGYILIWAEALLGGILFARCWQPLLHGIFAVLLLAVLLCVFVMKKSRAAHVTARIICGLFWLWAALILVEVADALFHGWYGDYITTLQQGISGFGGLFLCYLAPMITTVMLYSGAHTVGYDRLFGCVCLPAQLLTACVALFTDADIPWAVDGKVLPYVWFALLAVATVVLWLCARIRTPEQESIITLRRDARAAKRAKRLEKK